LADGSAALLAFEPGLRGLTGGRPLLYVDGSSGIAQARRTFHVQGAALWALSLSLGLVGALIFGQSFARQALIQSGEYGTMRALGLARRDLFSFGLARAGAVAAAAAAVAGIV